MYMYIFWELYCTQQFKYLYMYRKCLMIHVNSAVPKPHSPVHTSILPSDGDLAGDCTTGVEGATREEVRSVRGEECVR